jgi:hypothetical protein
VSVRVSPAEGGALPFSHSVIFTEESPQFIRFAVPFDADELEIIFQTETRTMSVRISVE